MALYITVLLLASLETLILLLKSDCVQVLKEPLLALLEKQYGIILIFLFCSSIRYKCDLINKLTIYDHNHFYKYSLIYFCIIRIYKDRLEKIPVIY